MAALTSTGVTINDAWYTPSKPKLKTVDVTLVLSSQGGLTNNIPASLFGLTRIVRADSFRTTSSVACTFGPNLTSSLNGSLLVAYAVETNGNPADVTGTFRGNVTGYE